MKIRTNFVSNSSSSSFLVALPKIPTNAEDIKSILFGKEEKAGKFTTLELSKIIWRDISDLWTEKSWREKSRDSWFWMSLDREEVIDFVEIHLDKFVYSFGFSDNDGHLYSHLEHGNVFKNLSHKRFSHH